MLNKQEIKNIIKEMIEQGEIVLSTDITCYKESYDDFINSCGALTDVDVEATIEVEESR